ncbi:MULTISPECIES: SHOCT domain-containing protein [Haladaptatus]|uniref:Putative membrane protein n=1 Tax=Haladaptatus paucihalophilus DX253 TaxID=797209 RepID=A0A1M6ZKS8_HALPU|nr:MULTISPECIES: SHOCT domain-containing protein [Haladaptatus]GKZ15439.1 hypothetical protein HAL_33200 [Haladaptatus sp. T7]SHL31128.1 putative membrane protein [Haladaptatus paucihalophilus DX253]
MTRTRRIEIGTVRLTAIATTLVTTATGTVAARATGAIGSAHMWDGGHMWGDGWMAGAGSMGLWGLLWMVLLVAVPLALVYYLMTRRVPEESTDPAMETVRERYARGEIDDEEFETLRAKLT